MTFTSPSCLSLVIYALHYLSLPSCPSFAHSALHYLLFALRALHYLYLSFMSLICPSCPSLPLLYLDNVNLALLIPPYSIFNIYYGKNLGTVLKKKKLNLGSYRPPA